MKAFAELLDGLVYTQGRNAKLRRLADYLRTTPDPDRGWALAALTDGLPVSLPVRHVLRDMVEARVDPELYRLSRDYVGDTAETVALIWPEPPAPTDPPVPPRLAEVVDALMLAHRARVGETLAAWLDRLDATGRWALLKLVTGALRVGVSARLAKAAVAEAFGLDLSEIEELWHGLRPPYEPLFAWAEGRGARPVASGAPVFRPPMLAHPLEETDLAGLDPADFLAEWKWDGIRVQLAARGGAARLFSRSGDDISASFPELLRQADLDAVLDGELLVVRDGRVAPFNDLQQRLNRKAVTARMIAQHPARLRLYDVLEIAGRDLRMQSFERRRAELETWLAAHAGLGSFDLSPTFPVGSWEGLREVWRQTRDNGIEGLMVKHRASPYLAGRPKGHWFKWKRAALTVDCVLMYAQRGSGKRSSYYSDYTFGLWRSGEGGGTELVPVGKAYSGFSDAELVELDRWIRNNTVERYGPVRAVTAELVLEVAFDSAHRSSRHKSGVAMRFPRIHRIRWDKPADEADQLEALLKLVG